MKDRFYRFFLPRIEPEQRLFQIRFLVALCSIMYGFLSIWSIYYIALLQLTDIRNTFHAFEVLPIVILAVLNTWLRTSLEKKEIIRVGIYISILYFLLGISLAVFHLLAGGLILGAFFMATDMVTSPVTFRGRIIFGAGCGLLTMLIRIFGGYPEGVSFAILLMNCTTPLIDFYTRPKAFGTRTMKQMQAATGTKNQ